LEIGVISNRVVVRSQDRAEVDRAAEVMAGYVEPPASVIAYTVPASQMPSRHGVDFDQPWHVREAIVDTKHIRDELLARLGN
jgi:hypothetical protein